VVGHVVEAVLDVGDVVDEVVEVLRERRDPPGVGPRVLAQRGDVLPERLDLGLVVTDQFLGSPLLVQELLERLRVGRDGLDAGL